MVIMELGKYERGVNIYVCFMEVSISTTVVPIIYRYSHDGR